MRHVVLAGVSTRAAAESAARAGFEVTTFDAYADLDQHPAVHAHAVRRTADGRFSPHRAARAAHEHRADAAVYLSSFDNHPSAVSLLGRGRALWGNASSVLARVRNPFDVADALAQRGFAVPAVARLDRLPRARNARDAVRPRARGGGDWMIKPRRSGGGRGVRDWRPGLHVGANCYLQSRIDGIAGSIVFVADERKAVALGLSRQLIGEPAFGASGFQYCGSILGAAESLFPCAHIEATAGSVESRDLFATARRLADTVTAEYGLIGVNGIDFIAGAGVPWPIEINPRWCSSMELVERAYGVSVFGAHAQACAHRIVPAFDLDAIARRSRSVGKAIVFSQHRLRARDTHAWLTRTDIRDIPNPGEEIRRGQPICTVFAEAETPDACHAALVARAHDIYRFVGEWHTEAA